MNLAGFPIIILVVLVILTSFGNSSELPSSRRQRRVIRSPTPTGDDAPTQNVREDGHRFQLAAIADLDKRSRVSVGGGEGGGGVKSDSSCPKNEWISYLISATLYLHYNESQPKMSLEWEEDEPEILKGHLGFGGRGMEFSELIHFDGHLLTCDDRTGIVYRLSKKSKERADGEWKLVPWVILADGDGTSSKSFKCEWAAVKDGNLWIGSFGVTPNFNFVKEISPKGHVTHHNWTLNYNKMAEAAGITAPGYVSHEAAAWSDFHKKWIFIPRKISKTKFDDTEDERKAANTIILADAHFNSVQLRGMAGELMPTRGVSSFKWLPLPGTNDSYIVALKSEEINGGKNQASYILAFDLDGRVLLPEMKVDDNKYEGLEFF